MTEIKTAQAWGHRSSPSALLHHAGRESAMFNVPYVIVRGLTEAEVHEAAALRSACRELGIETVEQLRELVGIACDACDERTVRATNRAENLVPLLRRRAGER